MATFLLFEVVLQWTITVRRIAHYVEMILNSLQCDALSVGLALSDVIAQVGLCIVFM